MMLTQCQECGCRELECSDAGVCSCPRCHATFELSYEDARRAAEAGDPFAQVVVGDYYRDGEVGGDDEPDYEEALRWYTLSADQGFATAMRKIAFLYEWGLGVPQDYEKALAWDTLSAERGNTAAILGQAVLNERLGRKPEAWDLYHKAAASGIPEAMTAIGKILMYGLHGGEEDGEAGAPWIIKGADGGDMRGQVSAGWLYESGSFVEKDEVKAFHYYLASARQGHAPAQTSVGYCYETGIGVEPDFEEAIYWYREAAKQGEGRGFYLLAFCYMEANGVEKDWELAERLLIQAIENEYEPAEETLEWLRNKKAENASGE
ncbi:MAG: SEL1-like repeat protein [Planctomycetaceae bacterium]|nr:SEL1-like repeat protein [Planctomycetaceae bacterium]